MSVAKFFLIIRLSISSALNKFDLFFRKMGQLAEMRTFSKGKNNFLVVTPKNANFKCGDYTYGELEIISFIKDTPLVSIGKFCSIADGTKIVIGAEHYYSRVSSFPLKLVLINRFKDNSDDAFSKGEVKIGNDVWVGLGVTILGGVTIGDGAVIGANSLVTSNVPNYAIVAGNPAKVIKYRFNKKIINDLIKISWWNWDEKKIVLNIEKFYCDIKLFVKEFKR